MEHDRRDDHRQRPPRRPRAAEGRRLRLPSHAFLLAVALGAAAYSGLAGSRFSAVAPQDLVSGALLSQSRDLSGLNGERLLGETAQTAPTGPTARAAPQPSFGAAQTACEPGETAAYCVYAVREGDTLSGIAEIFGLNGGEVPGWELLAASNKPDIIDVDDFIQPGQKLRVPLRRGVVHTIVLDETVGDLAQQFDVTSAEIIAANALANPDLLTTGQVIFIPDPGRLPSPELPDAGAAEPARPRGFIWPITASLRITNYMSARHPLGIDMGLSHAPGSAIVAVEDGIVEFAGGNACCSYGLYVIVDHGNGLKTLYAHLASLEVAQGQRVSQGQRLGPSGRTGYSTGVHLHFEVHLDGKRQDPMGYLPQP
jgi:murein DD-endopeptidase MepM/ murein hydrolase activator NlpD